MLRKDLERTIWIVTVAIMTVGLVSIYSASAQNTRVDQGIFFDQLLCAVTGLILMFFISRFNYQKLYDLTHILYGITVFLLVAVLVMGRHILGAKRWIEMGGINFQPSELAKLVMILVLARYYSHQKTPYALRSRGSFDSLRRELILPLLLTAVPMLLVFKQPDLGTSILILSIFFSVSFAGGLRLKYIFSLIGAGLAILPVLWKIMKPYQKDRIMVFLDPNADPLGAGYTIIQSKIAIGSGMLFGKGWLAGTQNQLNFLPERHTDFIFSVVGEEWGLVGTLFVVFCFYVLVNCGLTIARQTKDRFGFLLAVGIVSILAIQVVVNIGMVLGLFPVVGFTLPLVSYGRTSFMAFVIMIGILLNISRRQAA